MSASKLRRTSFLIAVAGLMIFAFANVLQAQETRGTISGTITDPNGQAVPNASVQVTDPSRGATQTFTTNSEGYYRAPFLVPGTYQISVEAKGFKKSLRDSVVVQIGQQLKVDIPLEVGGASETVTVTADVPQLNTENGSMAQVIDQRRLEDLPLAHGDPYKLIGLSPGVTHTGSQRLDRPFEPTHIVGYAIDGTRGNRSDLTIDGAPSTSRSTANNEVIASYVPPSDIVQEFKVQTATFDAQFGNTEGGVTNISIKSGTNALNGSAYYFGQPGGWAANDFFGNARGQARPETKADRFGGYVSGPVVIPWLYNGENKTFFLFGYEGIRDARPRFDAGAGAWVPTDALKSGNFAGLGVTIWDPLSRVAGTGTGAGGNGCATGQFCATQSFANGLIPDARISAFAKAVLPYFGSPKQPGLVGNIFDSQLTEDTKPYDNWTFRVDQNITDKNRLFVRGSRYDRFSVYNDYTGTPYIGVNFRFNARQGVIDDVHTFNSTTILNVRYGYNRFIRNQIQEEDAQGFDLTQIFGPSGERLNQLVGENRRFPRFDFTGGPVSNGMENRFLPTDIHSYSATLTKTLNTHTFKFGGELRIYREDNVFTNNDQTAQFIFDNTYTRQASNGTTGQDVNGLQGFAAFLLGYPTTMQLVRRADYSEYSKTFGFFVHDDWKVNRKLTVNLGLRYEVETALVERQNKSVSGFDFSFVQPLQAAARARLVTNPVAGYSPTNTTAPNIDPSTFNVQGGLLFAGKDTGDGLYETPANTFLPRVGAAYQLTDKTVLRGGFGMFAGFLGQRRSPVIQPGFTRTTTLALTRIDPSNPASAPIPQSASVFPNITILEPVGNAQGKETGLGTAISFFNQDPEVSKQARWQVGVQHELPWGFVLEAAYVGNYGYDIEIVRNINALPIQYLSTQNFRTTSSSDPMTLNNANLSANVANPFTGQPQVAGTSFTNSTIARSQLLRPFPAFGDVNTTNNEGKSWYNAGQFSLNKRMENGLTVGVAYTWSKWLQATEYLNAGDPEPTKMISDLDAPHRFSTSWIYELPFGKGKPFLSDGNVLDYFVGGWQFQGVYVFQTGFPITFGTNLFYTGAEVALPSDQRTTARWFNTAAFVNVRDGGTSVTASPVSHLRKLPTRFSSVRRDNINNVDLSFLKNTRINERMRIQFKLDLLNAFNEPYFPAPSVNPTQTSFGTIAPSNQDNYARRIQWGVKFLF